MPKMTTRSLDLVCTRPGLYVLCCSDGVVCMIEVEPGGKCWQLSFSDCSRAREIPPNSWNVSGIVQFIGPFAHAPTIRELCDAQARDAAQGREIPGC